MTQKYCTNRERSCWPPRGEELVSVIMSSVSLSCFVIVAVALADLPLAHRVALIVLGVGILNVLYWGTIVAGFWHRRRQSYLANGVATVDRRECFRGVRVQLLRIGTGAVVLAGVLAMAGVHLWLAVVIGMGVATIVADIYDRPRLWTD